MSKYIEFSLDTKNFKNIPLHKYTSDFTFLVNGKEYKTNRFIADILSPIIREYHFSDETINEFSFNIDKSDEFNNDFFLDFLNLARFTNQKVDQIRKKYYSICFLKLGNIEEYLRILPEFTEELSIDNIIELIDYISSFSSVTFHEENSQIKSQMIKNRKQIITYIAKNFEYIDKERFPF